MSFKHDYAYAIAVDDSGSVYVTGKSYGSGTSFDYATIKYWPWGDTAWVRRYNGPVSGIDGASAIALDAYGNIYVTGTSQGFGTLEDYATIKYWPWGDTAWVRRYNGPVNGIDRAFAIAVDENGDVYVTGTSYGGGTSNDYATIKYYANGDTAWVKRYNGSGFWNDVDEPSAIAVDRAGNVYVTGESGYDYATVKYSQSGYPPLPPFLLSPGCNATVRTRRPSFEWRAVEGASGYKLEISKYHHFGTILVSRELPAESTFVELTQREELKEDKRWYYWRVAAVNEHGHTYSPPWSSPRSFYLPRLGLRGLKVRAFSPIDLEVHSPAGDVYTKGGTLPPGVYYNEQDYDGDGDLDDEVMIEEPEDGNYDVFVIPEPGASPSDSFSLFVTFESETTVVAKDVKIEDMPAGGYSFNTLPYASLAGFVTDSSGGLLGVNVDIYDSLGILWQSLVTDDSGYYHVDSIPNGDYSATVTTPLGYYCDQETKDFTIFHVPVEVNFSLTKLDITPQQRGRGYWTHQVNAFLSGRGNAQESLDDMCDYTELIRVHFNEHQLNPIHIFSVDLESDCDERLEALRAVISPKPKSSMNDKAKTHLTTLLLNMVSGKIAQRAPISEDSATVSQAITYCNALITDSESENDEMAKDIAEMINEGQVVPSGWIDLTTPDISYKGNADQPLPEEYSLSQNYPNPFNATTQIEYALPNDCWMRLEVYNILGQKAATLVDGKQKAGYKAVRWDASSFASGIYFYRLEAREFVQTRKMILIR